MAKDVVKEYVDAKVGEALEMRRKDKVMDFAPVGNAPTSDKKKIPHTNDIPDVILKPAKGRKRTENKW